jgi:2-pyrone-4,6-dicarboxylate lactonase
MTQTNVTGGSVASVAAPMCAAFDPRPRKPRFILPPLSCDCHVHICGPASVYRYSPDRIYTPPDASLADYLKVLSMLGLERAILVQPSVYGTDNTVLIEALANAGPGLRGVAVVDHGISDKELERLNQVGIRGIRFNLVDVAEPKGIMPLEKMKHLGERIKPFQWHVELLVHVDDLPDFDESFAHFPVDIVVGHMGYMRPGKDASAPGFQALLRCLRAGRCWVKLTAPYRISSDDLPYGDVASIAQALVEAAPERMIWGSDWPHVMVKKQMPNDGVLCDLLADWIPDSDMRKRLLVDNPAKLYRFD